MEDKDKIRKIIKTTLREFLNEQEEYEQSWVDEKDYESKKKRFVWETKEKLTGFFGTVGVKNEQQIMKRIAQIFDHAMNNKYEYGISFMKDDGEHKSQIFTIAKYLNTNDADMIYDIIDGEFNRE